MSRISTRPGILAALALGAGAVHQAAEDRRTLEKYGAEVGKMDYRQRQKNIDQNEQNQRQAKGDQEQMYRFAIQQNMTGLAQDTAIDMNNPDLLAGARDLEVDNQAAAQAKAGKQADAKAMQMLELDLKIKNDIAGSDSPKGRFLEIKADPMYSPYLRQTPEFMAWVEQQDKMKKNEAKLVEDSKKLDMAGKALSVAKETQEFNMAKNDALVYAALRGDPAKKIPPKNSLEVAGIIQQISDSGGRISDQAYQAWKIVQNREIDAQTEEAFFLGNQGEKKLGPYGAEIPGLENSGAPPPVGTDAGQVRSGFGGQPAVAGAESVSAGGSSGGGAGVPADTLSPEQLLNSAQGAQGDSAGVVPADTATVVPPVVVPQQRDESGLTPQEIMDLENRIRQAQRDPKDPQVWATVKANYLKARDAAGTR